MAVEMKRQYDMASILQFFGEHPGPRKRAVSDDPSAFKNDDAAFDEWLDARLRELYADVLAEDIPEDLVAAVKRSQIPS
jgi:hypothetical protein